MTYEYKTVDPDYFYKQFEDYAKDMWSEFERVKRDKITNTTDEGEYLENIVIKFLKRYLPKRFSIGRGYIMNQLGRTSLQQDVVIYNADNYVLLKDTDGYQIFPVESVYSTVEVKSTLTKQMLELADKNIRSIKYLNNAALKVNLKTGAIVDAMQLGSIIFSTIFAFKSDSSLETCANNFEEIDTSIDYVSILNKGVVCYCENHEQINSEYAVAYYYYYTR